MLYSILTHAAYVGSTKCAHSYAHVLSPVFVILTFCLIWILVIVVSVCRFSPSSVRLRLCGWGVVVGFLWWVSQGVSAFALCLLVAFGLCLLLAFPPACLLLLLASLAFASVHAVHATSVSLGVHLSVSLCVHLFICLAVVVRLSVSVPVGTSACQSVLVPIRLLVRVFMCPPSFSLCVPVGTSAC